jgi:hypothetical protein
MGSSGRFVSTLIRPGRPHSAGPPVSRIELLRPARSAMAVFRKRPDGLAASRANLACVIQFSDGSELARPYFLLDELQRLGHFAGREFSLKGSATDTVLRGTWGESSVGVRPTGIRKSLVDIDGVDVAELRPRGLRSLTDDGDALQFAYGIRLLGCRLFSESSAGWIFDAAWFLAPNC